MRNAGEHTLPACPFRQSAEKRFAREGCQAVLGKLPTTTGWRRVLPRRRTRPQPSTVTGHDTCYRSVIGRGAGVGRGRCVGATLGVGLGLGVAVGVAVGLGVGVTVAVEVAVALAVGVAVGEAVGVGAAGTIA
jgi:hypothetical protein